MTTDWAASDWTASDGTASEGAASDGTAADRAATSYWVVNANRSNGRAATRRHPVG
jgi:hypothetical protein